LTELGRVTWAAIRLEDYTESVCAFVDPHNPQTDRRQIGQKVKDATSVLRAWPNSGPREDVLAWLTRATDALDRRNAILHATPVVNLRTRGSEQLLGAMPRKGSAYAEHPLTVEYLAQLEATLRAATDGWKEIVHFAWTERKRLGSSTVR
jgi:hypothetical protein